MTDILPPHISFLLLPLSLPLPTGIIHAVYELYGAELAGRLLTAFGRLFTYFLQGEHTHYGYSTHDITNTYDTAHGIIPYS
jgi:hypothetical protein